MTHQFETEIAKLVGLKSAIVFQHILFWLKQNANKGKNLRKGAYWTFCSASSLAKAFDYMTQKEIYNALSKLVKEGLLVKGNFNKSAFNKTAWYTITEKAIVILKRNTDIPKEENRTPQRDTSLQDIIVNKIEFSNLKIGLVTPVSVPQKNQFVEPTVEEVRAYCNERGNAINPELFCAYYEAIGWVRGRKQMKDWKAAIRYWEQHPVAEEKRFVPPTLDEVRAYCKERNNGIDPQAFVDYYESKGWKIGTTPMADWKASVINWENYRKEKPKSAQQAHEDIVYRTTHYHEEGYEERNGPLPF